MTESPEPPPRQFVDPKTGQLTETAFRWLEGKEFGTITQIGGIISGNAALIAAQQAAEAAAASAVAAANSAAQAAISATGSTETAQDSSGPITVNSDTYATFLTCNLDHAGGGDYRVTATAITGTVSDTPGVTGSGMFNGAWQLVENPNGHVLASGTFTALSELQGGEGGAPFYISSVAFSGTFPGTPTVYGDNESGAVTVELQLKRASGTNQVSGIFGSLLTVWIP